MLRLKPTHVSDPEGFELNNGLTVVLQEGTITFQDDSGGIISWSNLPITGKYDFDSEDFYGDP